MNKHIGGKLSDLVKINEQFARSTRIDKDDINQFGFIYSDSIDNFLKRLIQNQSQSQQDSLHLDRTLRQRKIDISIEFNFSFISTAAVKEKAAQNMSKILQKHYGKLSHQNKMVGKLYL